ncbi:MAG TPA: ATP-dependent DNA ligase [Methylomirabilota bacterium]|nr:ATP-dependent DNA ligase [Methylomirabilota bacterium]
MKFARLAEYFARLEGTTKRRTMCDLLSALFQEADLEEIEPLVYLCQEQLLPPYRGLELGLAEKLITTAIARAAAQEEKGVIAQYKRLGDLGLVAEVLVQRTDDRSALDVVTVYDKLLTIARTSGEGSIEQKIQLLADLLRRLSPPEVRYVVRFAMGQLRLGIGDPTILDALSVAAVKDKSLRPELERAYNLCSDLGLVARTLFAAGKNGIKGFTVQVGRPIRMALAERVATASEIVQRLGKCRVERKYDGLRLQCHKRGNQVEMFSRNLKRMTLMFPELIAAIRRQVQAKEVILEGEAVAVNEETGELFPFQVTVQRKRKHAIEEHAKEFPLVLFAFDLLYADGSDYTCRPYLQRQTKLAALITAGERIRLAEGIITDEATRIEQFFDESIEKGLEGIVAKRLDAIYQAGARNFNWIKLKRSYRGELSDTVDVVIVGYLRGRGLRARFGIGALLGAVYDEASDTFKTVAKIGSGLTEEEWVKARRLCDQVSMTHRPARVDSLIEPDVWVEPKYVFTVLADEITKSPIHTCGKRGAEPGYALRFPRLIGWVRADKRPEDATTVQEIHTLYRLQRRVKV